MTGSDTGHFYLGQNPDISTLVRHRNHHVLAAVQATR
jgi:hypothetical protein